MFTGEEALQKHVKRKHVDRSVKKKFPCLLCGYSCDKIGALERHMVTHTKVRAFKCSDCEKSFTRKCHLDRHIKTIHRVGESKHECKICNKIYNCRYVLIRHVKSVHDKIKSFVCPQCGRKFAESSHLTRHMRIHTRDNLYKCKFCSKSYTRPYSLSQHEVKNHTRSLTMA